MNQTQLQLITKLNLELLSCNTSLLDSIREYCKKYRLPIPNDPKIEYLVRQMLLIITEINDTTPDSLHEEQTPSKFTEPYILGAK